MLLTIHAVKKFSALARALETFENLFQDLVYSVLALLPLGFPDSGLLPKLQGYRQQRQEYNCEIEGFASGR